jgi:transposase
MDRAYEGDETRSLALLNGHEPIVPPKKNRKEPWDYDKTKYKCRNVVERCFRRLKEFRKVNTRYDKLDIMFLSFAQFAFIVI